ncbi:uncharacterized protein CLUP02_10282 [Colletotrichum lupini]|uniref:Uncharacterized protein n=1 Tax=Colletotrichum lupini TaxID=145971 RepID=A0A9Q8WIR2_9PEZI|nr:uncharacterized protein CLUP02_10282 [Colletotrichum lupini]KAK1717029.1 hypothetical protein BDP67DRAFT_250237 [Colletotrichum lupini]UQC84786.1 hypothetical protein CLUP02_10282 [Colletotrichum lupini]
MERNQTISSSPPTPACPRVSFPALEPPPSIYMRPLQAAPSFAPPFLKRRWISPLSLEKRQIDVSSQRKA